MTQRVLYLILLLGFYLVSYSQFKVIGYVPVSKYYTFDYSSIQFKKLTHLNIAFINPDTAGSFSKPNGLDSLIILAHQAKVKVLASIGGGNSPIYLPVFLRDGNRSAFIDSILKFIIDNQLDGEDIDLEGDAVDKNYGAFVNELGMKLKAHKKLMTAAVATYYAAKITNTTLNKFDFINIMSYDYTGPWTPKEPGQHSSFKNAKDDLDFFILKRGITKNKVILGVPFYGYSFSKDTITGMSFKNIILNNPGSEINDTLRINDSSTVFYNGLSSIRNKTALALNNSGGIMIWQLYQDANGEFSLLSTVFDEIAKHKKPLLLKNK